MNVKKTVLGTGALILGLNFGVNLAYNSSFDKKNKVINNMVSSIKVADENEDRLNNLIDNIEKISKDNLYMAPFWKNSTRVEKIDDLKKEASSMLSEKSRRTIHIGFGYDGQDHDDFLLGIDGANAILQEHGIFLKVKELEKIDPPDSFSNSYLAFGVKHSFDEALDIYFAWTSDDYSHGDKDTAITAMTSERVCLLDDDVDVDDLDVILSQEVLRMFSGKGSGQFEVDEKSYFEPVDKEDVEENLWNQFKDDAYDITTNFKRTRTVTINVALDDVKLKDAKEYMKHLKETYKREFNIDFAVLGYYEYELPESWGTDDTMGDIADKIKGDSNLYILFTGTDWNTEEYGDKGFSLSGQASPYFGYTWLETHASEDQIKSTLNHEVAHLFDADHLFRKDAIMHPYTSDTKDEWTYKTKETILKSKFKKWTKP